MNEAVGCLKNKVPNGTLHVHLRSYGLTVAAACPCPCPSRSALLPSLHWGECRLLPNSQSGITSRKSGLRGNREGLGCHLGQGHIVLCAVRRSGWTWQSPFWILEFACTVALNCQNSSQNASYRCEQNLNFFITDENLEAVCKGDWHNMRSYLLFNVQILDNIFGLKVIAHRVRSNLIWIYIDGRKFQTLCAMTWQFAVAKTAVFQSQSAALLFVHTLIFPHLSYCITTWSQACVTTLKPVYSFYKQILKVLDKKTKGLSLLYHFEKVTFGNFDNFVFYSDVCLMYKMIHKLAPPALRGCLAHNGSAGRTRASARGDLV